MHGRRTGLLIIHGTFGSPHEYDEVCQRLHAEGIVTRCVTLPGHGDSPSTSLAKVSAYDMLAECQVAYDDLACNCDHVVLLGHSLGGALSLLVAAHRSLNHDRKLRGVIALAAPYEHGIWVNRPQALLKLPIKRWFRAALYSREGFIPCKVPRFFPWWFPRLYREATWLFGQMRATLPNITVPVQLAHSPYDVIVPYTEMDKLAQHLSGSPDRRRRTLAQCGHQVFPCSREFDQGVELIQTCLKRWVPVAVPS